MTNKSIVLIILYNFVLIILAFKIVYDKWADMGPLELTCHAIWILACIILCVLCTTILDQVLQKILVWE
jgi:hypothetical protein